LLYQSHFAIGTGRESAAKLRLALRAEHDRSGVYYTEACPRRGYLRRRFYIWVFFPSATHSICSFYLSLVK
jgi:hypothetical protein